jgi:RNase P/RNase MRP subunit p29
MIVKKIRNMIKVEEEENQEVLMKEVAMMMMKLKSKLYRIPFFCNY